MMTLKATVMSFVLLVALLIAAVLQRHFIRQAQAEHQRLQTAAHEPTALEPDRPEESAESQSGRRELARLRNEVRELRAQKPDMNLLRSDNERLAAKIAETNKPRQPPSEEQGFVLRQNWAPAGFGSPEAAILTFFWAAREQDYQSALACMTPEELERITDRRTQEVRKDVIEDFARMAQAPGLRIAKLRTNSIDAFHAADSFKIDIQSNPDGPAITLDVRRIGVEWKID